MPNHIPTASGLAFRTNLHILQAKIRLGHSRARKKEGVAAHAAAGTDCFIFEL